VNDRYKCPMCEFSSDDRDEVRAHIRDTQHIKGVVVAPPPTADDLLTSGSNPLETWKQMHKISTKANTNGFLATSERSPVIGKGDTEAEALLDWAAEARVPTWEDER
jgi:hypothetical protein